MNFNIKSFLSASILTLTSASVFAFQSEVDVAYISPDSGDALGASYRYHTIDVNLTNTAWAEAPFMTRSTFFEAGVIRVNPDFGDDETGFNIGGTVNFAENWFAEGSYTDIDDVNILGLGVGYYYGKNAAVFLRHSIQDFGFGDDLNETEVGTKNIFTTQSGQLVNFEASLTRFESGNSNATLLSLGGDYYFTPKTSLGASIGIFDDSDVDEILGLSFNHYFNQQFGVLVEYEAQDDDDVTTLGVNFRF